MPFIIDRNMLRKLNRLTAEHLRAMDKDQAGAPGSAGDLPPGSSAETVIPLQEHQLWRSQNTQFSREEIRAALMLAKQMTDFASAEDSTKNKPLPTLTIEL